MGYNPPSYYNVDSVLYMLPTTFPPRRHEWGTMSPVHSFNFKDTIESKNLTWAKKYLKERK